MAGGRAPAAGLPSPSVRSPPETEGQVYVLVRVSEELEPPMTDRSSRFRRARWRVRLSDVALMCHLAPLQALQMRLLEPSWVFQPITESAIGPDVCAPDKPKLYRQVSGR